MSIDHSLCSDFERVMLVSLQTTWLILISNFRFCIRLRHHSVGFRISKIWKNLKMLDTTVRTCTVSCEVSLVISSFVGFCCPKLHPQSLDSRIARWGFPQSWPEYSSWDRPKFMVTISCSRGILRIKDRGFFSAVYGGVVKSSILKCRQFENPVPS